MAVMTEELRLAIKDFKSRINSFNFVINYEEPQFPIGSIESYKAQLDLANEYLEKHPEFNNEAFNTIGFPLFVKKRMEHLIEVEQLKINHQEQPSVSELLWDAYMILDHGDHDERLEMLGILEKHFCTFGKPRSRIKR
ncbi:TPA: hypothetical protein ACMDRZ_003035 [Vibrio cholerae]|uniref:hypothetical protein n=1 Tax=Vibrio cholerae TaxID=666 RepID=UPI001581F7AC|nr:hypothetical protein [Vibrio cholerae]QKU65635.1 hypothetical protein HPY17_20165 [Vibrio cholerae]QKU69439.1 hypothetical protein HPY10_19815 [Vibrio cholerae]HEJ2458021.1 hypothetical protein [Vibrio cholerae]